MKYIVKPARNTVSGYCYGCSSQCNNRCVEQTGCSTLCISKSK
ncbi:MAG: Clo7bot family Cys-rich peptide [Thermoanaerobacteraceae bacterium]|nr:Clo7bot family Cys-rich peptide [Thermoanaerobacter italicus]